MKILIVDDEQGIRSVIKEYCDRCDGEGEIEKECAHCRR